MKPKNSVRVYVNMYARRGIYIEREIYGGKGNLCEGGRKVFWSFALREGWAPTWSLGI